MIAADTLRRRQIPPVRSGQLYGSEGLDALATTLLEIGIGDGCALSGHFNE